MCSQLFTCQLCTHLLLSDCFVICPHTPGEAEVFETESRQGESTTKD